MYEKTTPHSEHAVTEDFWGEFERKLDITLEEVFVLAPLRYLAWWSMHGRMWTNSFFTGW